MNGFLQTRASFMMDFVVVAMFLIVPCMWWAVWLSKVRKDFVAHRKVQTILAIVLLIAVIGFEVDVRVSGWTHRAAASPYWHGPKWDDPVHYSLLIHLLFAIPTPLVWTFVVFRARLRFSQPLRPGEHSSEHRFWGRVAAIWMTLTAMTGWVFYALAFVA